MFALCELLMGVKLKSMVEQPLIFFFYCRVVSVNLEMSNCERNTNHQKCFRKKKLGPENHLETKSLKN